MPHNPRQPFANFSTWEHSAALLLIIKPHLPVKLNIFTLVLTIAATGQFRLPIKFMTAAQNQSLGYAATSGLQTFRTVS